LIFSRNAVVTSAKVLGTQLAHNFLYHNFSVTASWIVVLRHFGNDVIQLSYHPAPICANFSFNFLKNVVRAQRWPTAPLFVVNTSPPSGEFTTLLRHTLPIHNVTTNSNILLVNFRWTFNFCVEKPYDGTHLAFGRTSDRRCHFKHVSIKQRLFYHCQTSMAHR
jgi:hypothetical protein